MFLFFQLVVWVDMTLSVCFGRAAAVKSPENQRKSASQNRAKRLESVEKCENL